MSDEIVHLQDGDTSVSIATSFGNNAYSMLVGGWEFLRTPEPLDKWRATTQLGGIPLLAPWANRLDGETYYASGAQYRLNPGLGYLRYDANHLPIHGLVLFTDRWKVTNLERASVTSRLEFWRFPQWMAQFPFAHTIEITHRLSGTTLEVETAVENHSAEPMPLSLGFHPFFQLSGSPREEWMLQLAARELVVLSDKMVPTGERKSLTLPNSMRLADQSFDDVLTSLTGAEFSVQGENQRLRVRVGPRYPVVTFYTPPHGAFVCFEPMSAQTNAFNLTHAGVDAGLQYIAPGGVWRESFWISCDVGRT
ncbi:MAG: aldose 1-epimerase [Bryobacteraceae bacterium]